MWSIWRIAFPVDRISFMKMGENVCKNQNKCAFAHAHYHTIENILEREKKVQNSIFRDLFQFVVFIILLI